MPLGVLSDVAGVITHAKFCVNRLRGFSVAAPPKVPFLYLWEPLLQQFCTTVISLLLILEISQSNTNKFTTQMTACVMRLPLEYVVALKRAGEG